MRTLGTRFTGPYRAKVTAFIKQLDISLSYLHGPGSLQESCAEEEEAEVRGMWVTPSADSGFAEGGGVQWMQAAAS